MQLTLAQLFGEGASQTATSLIIQKSHLSGLTPSSSNRAEQLLAAIIATGIEQFTGIVISETGVTVTSETGKVLSYDNSELYELIRIEQWQTVVDRGKRISTFLIHEYTQEQ